MAQLRCHSSGGLSMSDRWHILGVGAIGGLFARRLYEGGLDVRLLARQPTDGEQTLIFVDGDTEQTLRLPGEAVDDGEPIEHLLICTKSYAVIDAVAALASRITPGTQLVLLVNGMGIGEALQCAHPHNSVIVGTTTAACYRDDQSRWHPVAAGDTTLGWLDDTQRPAPAALERWNTCIPGYEWRSDIQHALLAKLSINAVINPATALHDIDNGELLKPDWHPTFDQACAEVRRVLESAGSCALADQLLASATAVARATAANTSSMRADIIRGLPTEVEAILGYLLEDLPAAQGQAAAAAAVETPLLDQWLRQLRDYEAGRES